MKLAPKACLKPFTFLIFVYFFLASLPKSHILLIIVSSHLNLESINNSGSLEP